MVQFTSVTSLLSSTVALVFLLSASARPVPDPIDLIARTGTSELRNDALIRQNAPTTYFSVEVEESAKKITFSVKVRFFGCFLPAENNRTILASVF